MDQEITRTQKLFSKLVNLLYQVSSLACTRFKNLRLVQNMECNGFELRVLFVLYTY